MSTTIIIELGPESQAKLDKILAALEGIGHHNCKSCVETAVAMTKDLAGAAPAEEPKPEPEAVEHPADAVSPHGQPEPVSESEPPKYSKDDVLPLVQKLAAPNNPKREKAKAIVKAYAAKVSEIPEDKLAEVMEQLIALDKEG